MADWLAGKGWDVHVSTLRPSYPQNIIFEGYGDGEHDRELLNGVSLVRRFAPPPQGGGVIRRARFELAALFQILMASRRKEVRDSEYVVSICPSILVVIAAWLFAGSSRYHVAVVHDIQSGLARSLNFSGGRLIPFLIESLERFVLNRSDHLVVLTEEMGEILQGIGVRKPMTVLPPHIDEAVIFPLERVHTDTPVLLYSGNLGRKQGLDQILDLATVLEDRTFAIQIVIRGSGNHADQLKGEAAKRGLQNIVFEDFVPKAELNESMAGADIHLVPQLPEGAEFAVPSKIFSIMSSGRAFICTALPDSPLDNLRSSSKAFEITPPNDAEVFADLVIEMLGDRHELEAMGARGRSYIVENLARDTVMGKFESLLINRE